MKNAHIRIRKMIGMFSALIILLFIGFQFVCINQVRSLLEFSGHEERTVSPERMNLFQKAAVALFGVRNPKPIITDTPESLGLKYETVVIKLDSGERISAWLINEESGDDITILFHGFGSSKFSLLEQAQYLYSKGMSALLVDFRGSGESSGNRTSIGYYEAIDVKLTYEWAKKMFPDKEIILYGQSMGAAAILRAVAKYGVHPNGIIIESVFDNLKQTIDNRFDAIGFPKFPASNLMMLWAKIIYGIDGKGHNPVEYARHVKCPILVMHGKHDVRAKVNEGHSVFEHVASKNKMWVVFDELGHESLIDGSTNKWKESIDAFYYMVHNDTIKAE